MKWYKGSYLGFIIIALMAGNAAYGSATYGNAANTHADWGTDFAHAKALAKEEGKFILLDFTGSDWCPPCIQLDKDVFQKTAFRDYAKKNLVLVTLDFPRRGKQDKALGEQNRSLARKFEVQGYPTVIILNPQGKEVGRHMGYRPGGVQAYLEFLESVIKSGGKISDTG